MTHLHFTRYGALRDSGYHVFFRAVIAGVILAVIAHSSIFFLTPCIPEVNAIWKSFIPIPYSGTAMLTALLGFVLRYANPKQIVWTKGTLPFDLKI